MEVYFTTRQEYLMVVAMEECAEIQQAISKALRFGMDNYNPNDPNKTTNEESILTEYYQLRGVFAMLFDSGILHGIDADSYRSIMADKIRRVKSYMEVSRVRELDGADGREERKE